MSPLLGLCLLLSIVCSVVKAIPTIEAVGSKFFTSDGKQFFVKGVAYQLIEDDPLVETEQCERDATLMQQLGANTIRVYHVNETADHSGCMNAFAARGIYAFIDLDSFKTYIRYADKSSWTETQAASYRAVMDNFQQFDNTAGFFIGNEVLNTQADSHAAPYLLAAAVDMKKYRDGKGYRKIPIGYSATDTSALRPMLQDYVVCRPDASERMDFYAVNTYSWCGPQTTYETSGYPMLQNITEGYPVPIWLSEDGCNTVPPRDFKDQNAVFGPNMIETWSGAMIYEWIQELNQYGLVSYGPQMAADVHEGNRVVQGFTREGQPTPVQPDFSNLQQVWATITPSGVEKSAYAATFTTKAPECPAFTAGGWSVDPSAGLPTLGATGFSSGMASGVPSGSITVTGITSGGVAPTGGAIPSGGSADGNATGIGQPPDGLGSEPASSSAAVAASVGFGNPARFYFEGMTIALTIAGAGFILML